MDMHSREQYLEALREELSAANSVSAHRGVLINEQNPSTQWGPCLPQARACEVERRKQSRIRRHERARRYEDHQADAPIPRASIGWIAS
jgi:hypothetical protein